jgi:deoxyhypusine synthase
MTQALEVRALDIIEEWLRTGQIFPSQESIKTRIQMAASTGEIGEGQRLAMVGIMPQLISVSASIKLADQYSILKKADVDPNDLDIVEENLNRLYDVLIQCDDENMIMVQKMLYDFVDKLRKDSQHSQGGEQLDYSQNNEVLDEGVKVDGKQTPSEMSQGSGGGSSHVN